MPRLKIKKMGFSDNLAIRCGKRFGKFL